MAFFVFKDTMAGDWIKIQKDTPDKPEVLAMAARLGIESDAVVGKLVRIWAWFDTHTTNGNATCVTFSYVDRVAGVTGFAEQMALVGWLSQSGHELLLPNFDRHTGDTAKTRALGKNRSEKSRNNANSNDDSVTKPSLEKRREEKKNTLSSAAKLPTCPTGAISESSQEPDNSSPEIPPCPTQRILAIFGERLKELPQPRRELWDGSVGAKAMRDRWKWLLTAQRADGQRYAETTEAGLEWFGLFFQTVADSDFLTGRSGGDWRADLAWLMKPGNFSKVIQGNYTK